MATVFVSRDHTMDPLLNNLQSDLEANGVEVIRGPANVPGTVVALPRDYLESTVSKADVAVFSSRWKCDRATLEALPNIRGIVNPTIGVETLDIGAASDLGITVGHGGAPEHVTSMAEASVMLMLNLMFQMRKSEEVMAGTRPRPAVDAPYAHMMQGATIGLVGLGRIGRAVMDRLDAFGVKMIAYSPRVDPADVPAHVKLVDLDTLMRESDLVGIFIAVRPDNRKLIDKRALSLMKESAYLVNVSRGDAIDEEALIEALQEGRIAGAALDTFVVEPLPADSPLRTLPNILLTPHLVGHTYEATLSIRKLVLENVMRVLRDEPPVYCKNPEANEQWRKRIGNIGAVA